MLMDVFQPASSFAHGGILLMADWAITWKQGPVDFVSTLSVTAAYGLHVVFGFRFPNNDAEVIFGASDGTGKVYSHHFNLAL